MTRREHTEWQTRSEYLEAVSTVFNVSLGFYVVLSMLFVTLFGQFQMRKNVEAAVCSITSPVSTTIEITPDGADNVIDCSGQDIVVTGTGKLIIKKFGTANTSILDDGGVFLKVANLTIEVGGEVSADGQGYLALATDGGSAIASTGFAGGSGGGHGGAGGTGNTSGGVGNTVGTAGEAIGNKDYPLTLGGAGGNAGGGGAGGVGGGAIKIEASGTVTIDGKITANGTSGVKSGDNQTSGGGGAGGSIWVQAQILAGSGQVTAQGGGTDNTASYFGGGGGGGRIALICTASTTFPAGNASVAFGLGSQNGSIGTLVGPGCKPVEPTVLRFFEKNASAGLINRELFVSDVTTQTALTFASNLVGTNLKLEVELREKDVAFQNIVTNSQVSALSNKTCIGIPNEASAGSGVVGGGSPALNAPEGTGYGGAAGQNGGSNSTGGDGASGIVVVRYLTANAPATVTGGTITTSGAYTIHTFTNSGTFYTSENVDIDYLVVAGGGGGGGGWQGGGGGGGGVLSGSTTIAGQSYPIVVGAGGQGARNGSVAANGTDSSFNSLIAIGGGRGAAENPSAGSHTASVGGSGGGGSHGFSPLTGAAGTAGQGNAGGSGYTGNPYVGGGGGGAGGAGQSSTSTIVGVGGVGIASSITGTTKYYGAGGGGSRRSGVTAPTVSTYCGYVEVTTGLSVSKEYKWQARIVSTTGIASNWVQFGGNSTSSADFTIAGTPTTVQIIEGDNQSVQVGQKVPIRPKVRVVDASGYGVPLYSMTSWAVLSGSGTLSNSVIVTDKQGYVSTSWTLGTVSGVGNNTVRISRSSPAIGATFTASALPGAIASYIVTPATILSLVNTPFSYSVTAKDTYGNIVPFTHNLTVVPVSSHDTSTPGFGTLTPDTVLFSGSPSVTPWYNPAWGYRKKITFDNTTATLGVTSTALTNFPVLLTLSSSNFDFSKAKTNGEDLRITDSDGLTTLSYEIEKWDSAGQSALVWVKVPQVDADSGSDGVYAYYGNAAAIDAQSASGTWESNYKLVQHLSETTGTGINDSTTNNNDGTRLSSSEPSSTGGKLAGGLNFDGVNDYVNIPHSASLSYGAAAATYTLEAWINTTAASGDILAKARPTATVNSEYIFRIQSGKLQLYRFQNSPYVANYVDGVATVNDGQWHHVVFVNESASSHKLYIDGILDKVDTTTWTVSTANTQAFQLGKYHNNTFGQTFYTGKLDEARVEGTARSDAWIAATYKAQTNVYNFFGSEETPSETDRVYRDPSSGTISIGNASYTYSESIKLKVYDANGKVGYSTSILFVAATGSCPGVTIDTNQTWNAGDVSGGIFDCRGYGPFTVKNGYTLTLNSYNNGDSNYNNDYGATVLVDSLNVETGSQVTANGLGYPSWAGPANSVYGGYAYNSGGVPYGSVYEPTSLGSGGQYGFYGTPGAGAGAIKFASTGNAVINGTISANGNGGSGNKYNGGAGGSVWLDVAGLSGTGSLQANGGAGAWDPGNGGSGGRIALYYNTNSGFTLDGTKLQAYGGTGSYGYAGSGTVYIEQKAVHPSHAGILLVDNNNHDTGVTAGVPTGDYVFESLQVKRYGDVEFMGTTGTLTINSAAGLVGDSTKPLIKVTGTLQYTGGGRLIIEGVDLGINGRAVGINDVTIGGTTAAGVTLYANTWYHNNSNGHTFGDVIITGNGILTTVPYQNGTTSALDDYGVKVTMTGLTLQSGGKITSDGLGYPSWTAIAGDVHGGYARNSAGVPYGSVYEPVTLGSGGDYGYYGTPGAGGGAMKLTVSGAAQIDGIITVDGLGGSGNKYDGGAAGSIWLDVGTLSGSGTIRANGGAGAWDPGNGGSGGRIALYYTTNNGFTLNGTKIQAYGGTGANGYAGPGTVYLENKSTDPVKGGTLLVDNNSHNSPTAGVISGIYKFVKIDVKRYGHVEFIGNDSILEIASGQGMVGDSTKPLIKVSGTINYTGTERLTIDGVDLGVNGRIMGVQDVTIGQTLASGVTLYANTWYHNNVNTYSFGDVIITGNGILTMVPYQNGATSAADDYGVTVAMTGLTLNTGGKIISDGLGYPSWVAVAGDVHGGYAINSSGIPYGSVYQPATLGSGGDYGYYGTPGAGGGAMKMTVSGNAIIDGTISANGTTGSGNKYDGGAGGSIWLDVGGIAGSGTLQVNGAAGAWDPGNGGSGGRIAVYYTTNNGYTLNGTNLQAYGGSGSTGYAGPGTVYLEHKGVEPVQGGTLLVDNNSHAGLTAGVITGNYKFSKIDVKRYGHVEFIGNDSVVEIASGQGMVGDSTKPLIKVSGTINYTGVSRLTIDGVDLGVNGRLMGVQDVTIGQTLPSGVTLYANTWYHNNANRYTLGDVIITGNGILTVVGYQNGTTAYTDDYGVGITMSGLTVQTGGLITGTGLGYPSWVAIAGDVHGGYARNSSGIPYGSVYEPETLGSGGDYGFYGTPGAGGGAVKLTVTGDAVIDGNIVMNGTAGGGNKYDGGAGGSIWLDVAGISGSGLLQTIGGDGAWDPGNGGSGGRIAIYYTTNNGYTLDGTKLQAYGGAGSTGYAGPGTVYLEQKGVDSVHGGKLLVDNANRSGLFAGVTEGTYEFKEIEAKRNGHVEFIGQNGIVKLSAGNALVGDTTKSQIKISGTLEYLSEDPLTVNGVDLGLNGKVIGIQDLNIGSTLNSAVTLYGKTWYHTKTNPYVFGNVAVSGLGSLVLVGNQDGDAQYTDDEGVYAQMSSLDVAANGTVTADGKGYPNDQGPSYGGAHGGYIQNAASSLPQGDFYAPTMLGSGGGWGFYGTPGAGGGAMKLSVSGATTINGSVSANGTTGSGNRYGSGAGGSIWIDTGTLAGSGTIKANSTTAIAAEAGTGGRIALYFNENNGFDLSETSIQTHGGSGASGYGGPGTVYVEDRSINASTEGSLYLQNGGHSGRGQDFAAGVYNLHNVTIGQNVTVWIKSDPTAVVDPLDTVAPHNLLPDSSTLLSYNFDDTTATSFADASGSTKVATGGKNTFAVAGKFGNAQKITAGDLGLTFENIDLPGDWSIDMWVKFPLPTTSDGWRTLIHYNGTSYHNIIVSSGGQLGAYNNGWYDSGYNINALIGWHHVAAVATGSSTKYYIDGQLGGSVPIVMHTLVNVLGNAGASQQAGVIDEVRIQDKAMSEGEVLAAAQSSEPYIPDSNTLALWHLDEDNIERPDSSNDGLTVTEVGAVSIVNGRFGKGRNVAAGQLIRTDEILLGEDWTLDLWASFPLPATGDGWRTLVSRNTGTYHPIIVHSGGNLGTYNNGWSDSGYSINSLSGWHHVAAVGSGTTTTFYIDGAAVGTTPTKVTQGVSAFGNVEVNGANQASGLIDEVHVRNRAVSAQELLDYVSSDAAPVADSSTKLLLHLNQAETKTIIDASANALHGTLYGTGAAGGRFGNARFFTGMRDYVQVPANTMDFSTGMTLLVWAKPTSTGSYARFVDFGNGCPNDSIILARTGTSSDLLFETSQGTGGVTTLTGTGAITQNEWHHYAVTVAANGDAVMYKDGNKIANGTITLPQTIQRSTNYLGRSCNGGDALYAGYLDEVHLYNRQLTAEQVKASFYGLTEAEYASYQTTLVGQGVRFDLTGDFTLASGASILGVGIGFPSDAGQGRGGQGIGYSGGGGGANGGSGGPGQSDGANPPASGGIKFGDQLLPLTLGAGGGSSGVGAFGGEGGGAFGVTARGKLTNQGTYIDGDIVVAGTINMNGTAGKTGSPGGGGGAGGSILLHGNTCDINGTLTAEGGEGGNSDIDGGGGGGGHVSVLYNVGPCEVTGSVSVSEGVPTDALNYSAQVGQVGTYPPEPNSVPWPSQYRDQFEVIEEVQGSLEIGKRFSALKAAIEPDVLGTVESAIPVGGVINGTTVTLKADAYDAGARPISPKRLKIQVEIKKVNQAFTGNTNITDSNIVSFAGGTPVVLSVTINNLDMGASYKWRVRTANIDTGLNSEWQEFGGNSSNSADFTITTVAVLDLSLSTASMELPDTASITLSAKNSLGATDTSYRGTVTFTSSSGTADLPSQYTFTSEDAGTHTFSDSLKFYEAGSFSVTAEDTVNPSLIDTAMITINLPPVPFITLSSSSETIIVGESVTLSWQSAYLTDVSIDQGIGVLDTNGNREVTPPLGETTYTAQGRQSNGQYISASVTITVNNPEIPYITFTTSESAVVVGDSVTLQWETGYLSDVSINQGVGVVDVSGTRSIAPPLGTTTYTLQGRKSNGEYMSESLAITAVDQNTPYLSFTVSDTSITVGQKVTLHWRSNLLGQLSIDQNIGNVASTGYLQVTPSLGRTTYRIQGRAANGALYTTTVTITANAPPPVNNPYITIKASQQAIVVGENVVLQWQSAYLTNITMNKGIGKIATTGNMKVTPPLGSTTYTVQGQKSDGKILSADVTITATKTRIVPPVVSCPVITVFTVSNRIVKGGDAVTINWQVQNADKISIDAFSGALAKSGAATVVLEKTQEITLFASKGTCKRTQVLHVDIVNSYPWEGAGGMLIGLLAIETIGLQIGVTQGNIWFALLGLIDRSKKRKPWGVVYNSVTKELLSRVVVRLWDAVSGKLVDTVVTDANGIFKLTPRKGKYVVKVALAGFSFPSKLINTNTDTGFTNIYTGEVIEILDESEMLMISIPMDPEKRQKKAIRMQQIVNFLEELVGVISPIILIAGFIYSVVVTLMFPLPLNYVILGLYALTFLIKAYVYISRPKLFGLVTGVDGKYVSGLEIGLFDTEFKNLISRTFTNKQGAYNFVVKNQAYYLQVMDPSYKVLSRQLTKEGILIKKSSGNSGVKLVTENLVVYPIKNIVKK